MDGDKTPTQATASLAGHGWSEAEGHLAVTSSAARIALPGSGLLRKSASSMALRGALLDNIFAPGRQTTVSTTAPAAAAAETSPAWHVATTVADAWSVADNSPAGPPAALDRRALATFKPRADRGTEVTVQNAQGIWPAEAVVFVANLPIRQSLDQLEHACHDLFDVFGRNVVKVKFDRKRHPFALVQFETTEAAMEALTSNQDAVIDGRPIRLEQGKAERTVVIARKDGAEMTEGEARAVLEPYGALNALFPTYSVYGDMTNLPGFSARFVYYQDCHDALYALSGAGSVFRLQLATGREQDARGPGTAAAMSQTSAVDTATTPQPGHSQHGVGRNIDSKSIFVGNLPHGATNNDLVNLFSAHGTVIDCKVINKLYYHEGAAAYSTNTFGFVEFASYAEAEAAVAAAAAGTTITYADKYLAWCKLRVEPKEYTCRHRKRLDRAQNSSSSMVNPAGRSPRRTTAGGGHGQIAPQVANALGACLAANNVENSGPYMPPPVVVPPPTPPPGHLLPTHLFSPSPPGEFMWPVGYYDAGGAAAQAYNPFGWP